MDGNLQKYDAFIKTAELGSFTRAAEALAYSQSSVSKMIADLEQEWGIRLLERSKSGAVLTTDGASMLPYVRGLLEEARRMQGHVDDLLGIQSGTIRIGTAASVATHWLPNVIRAFRRDYPKIEYELLIGDYGEMEQWVADGRVDLGILRTPTRPEFDTIPLWPDEMVVIMPKGHPLAAKSSIDPHDLNDQDFVLMPQSGQTETNEILERYQLHPNIRFFAWDDTAVAAMVEAGLGIGILPQLILLRTPYQIETRSFTEPYYRELAIAVRDQQKLSAAVRRFLTYMKP